MLRWKSLLDTRLPKGVRRKERGQTALDCRLSRRLAVETLEHRRMLAVVTVDSVTDISDGDTASIADLIAMPGPDNVISLREAIVAANNTGGLDNIEFNIAGGGVQTIQPGSVLPAIADPVIIDGYTQAGSAVNTSAAAAALNTVLTVEIDGRRAGATNGLEIVTGGGGSTIRGLVINSFVGNGVEIRDAAATGNMIEGNFIGTTADGTVALPNGIGVAIVSADNMVGGTTAAARNLISGNSINGVSITGASATGNMIEGNFIGTTADGTAALANGRDGVEISSAANNTVGGTTAGARNVISGNSRNGVFIVDAAATGNMIQGNFIGTTADGTSALANGDDGVDISFAANNTVGGTAAGARNVISGNDVNGVFVFGLGVTGNMIEGNFIGTDADGTAALANGLHGVQIDSANNTVGGTAAGAGNRIAFNGLNGISILDTSATGNGLRRNAIFSNAGLGIDLAGDGVTSNDPADADTGENNLQNFPQFVGLADLAGGMITLTYAVDTAVANAVFPLEIELFVADADGQEGQTFVATDTYSVADQAAGEKTIVFTAAPGAVVSGDLLVATATDALGNTSEFSAAVAVIEPGMQSVDLFLDAITGLLTIRDKSGLPDGSISQQDNDVTLTMGQFDTGGGAEPGLLVTDPFGVNALGAGITQVSGTQAFVPATALTPSLSVDLQAGDDQFTVDVDGTNQITIPIIYDGGTGSDQLVVHDAALGDTVIHRVGADGRSGSIAVGALPPTHYSGVESALALPIDQLTSGTGQDGMGRLVVFKNDPFEANNTLQTGTFLGAGPTINVDPTIDPGVGLLGIPGDADFYQFVAQETGTLDFQLFFEPVGVLGNGNPGLPGDGELNATFFDSDGAPIAGIGGSTGAIITDGAGVKIGERITVPVVRNQTYFVRVQGDTADAINVYNFTAITVAAPVPELVDLQAASDSGRNNTDDVTNITTPTFNIVLDDDRIDALANLDLLPDTNDDNAQTANFDYGVEVFNNGVSIGYAFFTGGANNNTWQFTAQAGDLGEGDGNHISAAVWVRDRATPATIGRHELSTALQVTLDTMAPPVSFGLANPINPTDGLLASSDTVSISLVGIADRVTNDLTPTFWGRAEADSIVTLYNDLDGNGVIDLGTDQLLGQTVATPLDGNNAFAGGEWTITSVVELGTVGTSQNLLVTAQDVAGNPVPGPGDSISPPLIDALSIFVDAAGPMVTSVAVNAQPATGGGSYDLFDPKPSVDGPTPPINSITINLLDFPVRVDQTGTANDFLYPVLDGFVASTVGNYSVVGDHVGQVGIAAVTVDQAIKAAETVTAVTNATNFTADGFVGAFSVPAVGDFVTFNNGGILGLLQRVTAFDAATGAITLDQSAGAAPAVGDGFSVISAASLAHAAVSDGNTAAQASVTTASNATNFFAANINGGSSVAVGDYLRFNTGGAAGTLAAPQIRLVTAFDATSGLITVDSAFPAAPVAGDGFTLLSFSNVNLLGMGGFLNTASITLNFAQPLPDDRFTLTVNDNLTDPAGNKLDGESDAAQPLDDPLLGPLSFFIGTPISGDLNPGGPFVARFTVDTRAEIGVWAAGTATVDTNGNFLFDPTNIDASNRDIAYQLGFSSDNLFAGNFVQAAGALADGFDKLAAYGRVGNQWRWMIDTSNDGVPDIIINEPLNINGLPVAGNFDGDAANGDEVGVFDGTRWYFDTNHDFLLDAASVVVASYKGFPIVGDFDGNGTDDLGAYTAVTNSLGGNLFSIDTNRNGTANNTFRVGLGGGGAAGGFNGFAGVRERPVAADMNADGIDDIGLWVPDGSALVPGNQGEWYFLVSGDINATALVETSVLSRINNGFVAYTPSPFGHDIHATFGNSFAVPLVGNFDPPVATSINVAATSEADETSPSQLQEPASTEYSSNISRLPAVNDVGSTERNPPLQVALERSVAAPVAAASREDVGTESVRSVVAPVQDSSTDPSNSADTRLDGGPSDQSSLASDHSTDGVETGVQDASVLVSTGAQVIVRKAFSRANWGYVRHLPGIAGGQFVTNVSPIASREIASREIVSRHAGEYTPEDVKQAVASASTPRTASLVADVSAKPPVANTIAARRTRARQPDKVVAPIAIHLETSPAEVESGEVFELDLDSVRPYPTLTPLTASTQGSNVWQRSEAVDALDLAFDMPEDTALDHIHSSANVAEPRLPAADAARAGGRTDWLRELAEALAIVWP